MPDNNAFQTGRVAYRNGPTAYGPPQQNDWTGRIAKQLGGVANTDWPMALVPEVAMEPRTEDKL